MPKQDKTLICSNCHQEFVWATGEQDFYTKKSLNQPKFCPICRGKHQADQKFKSQYSSTKQNNE